MKTRHYFLMTALLLASSSLPAQQLNDTLFAVIPAGAFTMGEPDSLYKGPPGSYDATEHSVTLSTYKMMKTEVTNEQYVAFLNAAYSDGLLTVATETKPGPDNGFTLVYGSASAPGDYKDFAIINLSGTRVMKDHVETSESQDGNPFTGIIEPENPLNISYIGFDDTRADGEKFYVKDPRNSSDFDWQTLTDYYNYQDTVQAYDTSVLLNDYDSWPELKNYPDNLPTVDDVKTWPATFIRWYGAKAFAMFYGVDLPTEAQWEYAGRGGADFTYATSDGSVAGDGTSANWNWAHGEPALHHVYDVRLNSPNPYGLYNLAGNVWEWCEDWWSLDFYDNGSVTDPVNTDASSNKKVRRGGSWNYHETTLKNAARAEDEKFKGNDHFGFRVVDNNVTTSVGKSESNLPQEFELMQNFPNPFNPTTTIRFSVPAVVASNPSAVRDEKSKISTSGRNDNSSVTLKIFNALGAEVATLVNEHKGPGNYSVNFNAAGLPSGMYFYRLTSGNFTAVKKLLLLK